VAALLADVEDVFDEFNGGVFHARAIQRFARHFFENGDASALVLVGDASEDQSSTPTDRTSPTFHRVDRERTRHRRSGHHRQADGEVSVGRNDRRDPT
jgi:hypothetical protein